MINGNWAAFTDNELNILNVLKCARRKGDIPDEVSIVRDILQKEIKIYTDSGRCMRPLLLVGDDNKLAMKAEHIEDPSLTF
jgi:DNA-directed RNA polymerase II subunit RPB2